MSMWAGIVFQIHVLWDRKSSRCLFLGPSFTRKYLMLSWCSSSYEWGVEQFRQNMVRSGLEGISSHTMAYCWCRVHSWCSEHANKIPCLSLNRWFTLLKHCIRRLHAEHMENHKRHFLLYNLSGICRPAVKTSVLLRDLIPWSPWDLSFSFIFLL